MPSIPVQTPLGYLSVFLIIAGIFLVITGLGILKIQKITIAPGKVTWGSGIILLFLGVWLLFPDIERTFGPTPTSTFDQTSSISIDAKLSPTPEHCIKPTTPFLVYPGENEVQPNHYYGQGKPWKFDWRDSLCERGSIQGYRIVVMCSSCQVPAIDKFVEQSEYVDDTTGTINAPSSWIWKVQAIDDRNQPSSWSEQRYFEVGPWQP